jgi:uncharacterized phosphosugar-binding protein
MKKYEQYVREAMGIALTAVSKQKGALEHIALILAQRIKEGGIIHVFGTGHSHMLAEEAFFRAGGLACINAMLEPNLMLHHGVEQSSWLEKQQGWADVLLDKYRVEAADAMIVISNSGRNSVPIEVAMEARKRGLYTIALTSLSYQDEPSRHPSGLKLCDAVDQVLDNGSRKGDALVEMGGGASMGATSTVVGSLLINALMMETAEQLFELGIEPPIIESANVDKAGVELKNRLVIEKYRGRVRYF